MRAVGAELGAAPAGQHGEPAQGARPGPPGPAPGAGSAEQVPPREREDVEVGQLAAAHDAPEGLPRGQAHESLFRLAMDEEVGVGKEQVRQLGGGQAHEAHARAARARGVGPARLVAVVDERREDEGEVALEDGVAGEGDLVARAGQDGGQVGHGDARHVVDAPAQGAGEAGDLREGTQPRPVSAHDRVLVDEPFGALEIREHDAHVAPPEATWTSGGWRPGARWWRTCRRPSPCTSR